MATDINKTYYCEKCNRTMSGDQFYSSYNLEKYPNDGKLNQCKKCLTMHVNNWDPQTYLWILQEIDVPYVPDEWNNLLQKYGVNRSKMTGMTILGRYLSKMRLKQYCDFRWKDTDYLQEVANNKMESAMKAQGYDAVQIAEAIEKQRVPIPEGPLTEPDAATDDSPAGEVEDYFDRQSDVQVDFDLTDEDKLMLRLKWGKGYKPEEWVKLEQLYNEFLNSYDIQSAGHIDTLKLICKTSLKANQLIDIGDIEGFQKISKVYDNLMKSGKFTAAQNKADSGEYVDSISELVSLCEQQGFIPRYYTDGPMDKVDETLQDTKDYVRSLVMEEMNLGSLIENAIKTMQMEESKEEDEDDEEEDLSIEKIDELKDEDFMDHQDFLEEQEQEDEDILNNLLDNDEEDEE